MTSDFAQRLDFLMSLTGTTNSALARELSFDASYISRIRAGKRGVPLHQPFVEPAAAFLGGRIVDSYQLQAIERAIGITGSLPEDPSAAARTIADWLLEENGGSSSEFQQILDSFASHDARLRANIKTPQAAPVAPGGNLPEYAHFIGNGGKREAVELFLDALLAQKHTGDLLLYSDERMDWLIEDLSFTARWQRKLIELVGGGARIRILHTLTRDVGEMVHAVHDWLPLYLTGKVSSLYCPRIRDGICHRTLFVAPGKAAITANSIGDNVENMVNALSTDPMAVRAYEREFLNLKALCKPLVRVARLDESERLANMLSPFAASESAIVCNGSSKRLLADLRKALSGGPACQILDTVAEGTTPRSSAQLPASVVALVSDDGFALFCLDDPQMALVVTERLLTAAFADFLAACAESPI